LPIIAVTPPVTPPGPGDDAWRETRRLTLRTLDGSDEQMFVDDSWVIMPGATGLGVPPVEVITQQTPGMDGAWLREIRVQPREVFLPIFVGSDTGQVDYLAQLDRLQDFLDFRVAADPTATDGTLLLVSDSPSGQRQLPVVYTAGLEGDEGQTVAGTWWATLGLRLLAVDPWWRDATTTVLEFRVGDGEPFLATADSGHPWPRRLSPSVTAGVAMPVAVGGRVPVWPTIDVVGPAGDGTTISTGAGMAVELAAIDDGETLTLVTDPRRRSARVDGEPAWDRISTGPTFRPLPAGAADISVVVPDADDDTRVRLSWQPGWRAPW
jgi:hypothetical protein